MSEPSCNLLRAKTFVRSVWHGSTFGSANRPSASPGDIHDHDDQENYQENVEQKLRDPRGCTGNAAEPEKACDEGNDKGDECII
jgi:hypothetical protein